jgi:hypothetical protein
MAAYSAFPSPGKILVAQAPLPIAARRGMMRPTINPKIRGWEE